MKEITIRDYIEMSNEEKGNLDKEYHKDCDMTLIIARVSTDNYFDEELSEDVLELKVKKGYKKQLLEKID